MSGMQLDTRWKRVVSKVLARLLEIVLGGWFLLNGLSKSTESGAKYFVGMLLNYRLMPEALVGIVAAGLPTMEFLAGLLLVLGVKRRSCILLVMPLLSIFMVVMAVTLLRGLNIECGCGLFMFKKVSWGKVLFNSFFLVLGACLYWLETKFAEMRMTAKVIPGSSQE